MAVNMSLLLMLAFVLLANGASISKTTDSYQNVQEEDINENLILDEEPGDIEGLLPPKPEAKDYFVTPAPERRESSYVIDRENNTLRLKGEAKTEQEELSSEERDAIKEVTAAFARLLAEAQAFPTDSDVQPSIHPVVILSDDGVAVELTAVDEKSGEVNVRQEGTTEVEAETTTVSNGEEETFTTDDALPEDEARDVEETGLIGFFHSVWDVVRASMDYATGLLHGLTRQVSTEEPKSTEMPSEDLPASSVATLVAFEESPAHLRLPAQEFEKGGRDIDSLLYGRGIA